MLRIITISLTALTFLLIVTFHSQAYAQTPPSPPTGQPAFQFIQPQKLPPAPSAPTKAAETLKVTPLGDEFIISIKDHGSSQTVMVFRIDRKGKISLTHKAKFFY